VDIVAAVDPAGAKKGTQLKRVSARAAIVVVGQDMLSRIFSLQAWAARIQTPEFIDKIIEVNSIWRPQRLGIEANAMQVLFGGAVEIIARLKGEHLPFEPIYQPTNVKKEWRIRTALQPVLVDGRLFLGPDQDELRAEITDHPNCTTFDLVDALATAIAMLPDRRAQYMDSNEELKQLAQYLRETGCPPHIITQRLNEERQRLVQLSNDPANLLASPYTHPLQ